MSTTSEVAVLRPVEAIEADLARLKADREELTQRLAATASTGGGRLREVSAVSDQLDGLDVRERVLRAQLNPAWRASVEEKTAEAAAAAEARRAELVGLYGELLTAAAAVADVVKEYAAPAAALAVHTDTLSGRHGDVGGMRIRGLLSSHITDSVDGTVELLVSPVVDRLLGTGPADWLGMPELRDPVALRAEAKRIASAAGGASVSASPTGAAPNAAKRNETRNG
jgi:hypothetical protein